MWAGDFIDDASSIQVVHNSSTLTDGSGLTITTTEGKKIMAFTSAAVAEFQMQFTVTKTVTPGQAFVAVELTGDWKSDGNRKPRLTLDGTAYNNDNTNFIQFTVNTNHTLIIFSPLNQNETLRTKYLGLEDMSLTFANIILYAKSASSNFTIYRCGLYSLGEILDIYASDLKTNNFQIDYSMRLLNDAYTSDAGPLYCITGNTTGSGSKTNDGSTTGIIETKYNNNTAFTTLAQCKLLAKVIDFAKIPDNYRYFYFRRLNPTDAVATTDIFDGMNENAILMIDYAYLKYLPTKHAKTTYFDYSRTTTTFVDGTAPTTSISNKITGRGSSPQNWCSYTRDLKAGYNSLILPMKYISSDYIPSGITFYGVGSFSDNTVTFTSVTPTSGDYTSKPLIVKAATEGLYTFVGRDAITSVANNYVGQQFGSTGVYFVGSFVDDVPGGDYTAGDNCVNYGITSDGTDFAKMGNSTKTTYYRAFISDKRSGVNQAPLRSVVYDEKGTTGISMLHEVVLDENAPVYNLNGVRMQGDNLPRGIYVRNGKKFIVK